MYLIGYFSAIQTLRLFSAPTVDAAPRVDAHRKRRLGVPLILGSAALALTVSISWGLVLPRPLGVVTTSVLLCALFLVILRRFDRPV